MSPVIPFVWSADVLRHEPEAEVWVGVAGPGSEVADRARVLHAALLEAGHPELPAVPHPDEALFTVHAAGMVDWLRTAAAAWAQGPYEQLVGRAHVVPYVFPTPMMTSGQPWRYPSATHARAGVWCYDTMTLVGPGTWEAARAAADCALTAAALVAGGERAVYALCRPPGHHAAPAGFGGSCYLNNAALAARSLVEEGLRVAVLDVDAHHGNGTQAVFWDDPRVYYGSVHVDPGAGWFPHVVGYADETGPADGDAAGTTRNVPLAPGSGDAEWLEGLLSIAEGAVRFGAQALVVSLGVDAALTDPESPLRVTRGGFASTGRVLATLDLPTVLVQEGGYDVPSLGDLVTSVLSAFPPFP
jgi:acetoin utilization deacetylase AcuC-like enzyme